MISVILFLIILMMIVIFGVRDGLGKPYNSYTSFTFGMVTGLIFAYAIYILVK
jgi:hypothetical protein